MKSGSLGLRKVIWVGVIGVLVAMPMLVAPGRAQDSVSAPAADLDLGFLNLPAHDIERVPPPAPAAQSERIQVGDQLVLSIRGLPSKDLKLEVPKGSDSLNDLGWEIIPDESSAPEGEYRFKAVPLKPGKHILPSLSIQDAAGTALARTNPLSIEVVSAIKADDPKPEEPVDLRPPVSLHFPWWLVFLGAFLVLALVGAGIYFYRRINRGQPKEKPTLPEAPPRPEDEVALEALTALAENGPLKRGEFKAHYFRVSEILKVYVGARYRFDAVESTTREMINQLEEKRSLSDQQVDRLEALFERLDLVKFTDYVPVPDEGLRLLGQARDFVQATRRLPEIISPGTAVIAPNKGEAFR